MNVEMVDEEQFLVRTVRDFIDREVKPAVNEMEHRNEYPEKFIERYFRDAPLMIVGEGTNEIQKNVIAAQLIHRGDV